MARDCLWRVRARHAVPLLRKIQGQKAPAGGQRYVWRKERCGDGCLSSAIFVRCCVGTGTIACAIKGGQKKCQAERLADYEANGIFLHETVVRCQVIICVEENNPRRYAFQNGISAVWRRVFEVNVAQVFRVCVATGFSTVCIFWRIAQVVLPQQRSKPKKDVEIRFWRLRRRLFRPEVLRCVSRHVKSLTSEEVSYMSDDGY